MLQSCLNVLVASSWCDRRASSFAALYCLRCCPLLVSPAGAVHALPVGLEPRQTSVTSSYGKMGYFCIERAVLEDEASLYKGRRRSNFTGSSTVFGVVLGVFERGPLQGRIQQ